MSTDTTTPRLRRDAIYTADAIAKNLGLHKNTIVGAIHRGDIPVVEILAADGRVICYGMSIVDAENAGLTRRGPYGPYSRTVHS